MTQNIIFGAHASYVNIHLLDKVVTSSVPSSEDCAMVAIYGEYSKAAWCTHNCKKWRPLELDFNCLDDLRFCKNKLYIVCSRGHLLEVENIGPNPKVTIVAPPPACVGVDHLYLAEGSGGSLIMIARYVDNMLTYGFKVYKLDSMNSTWLVVDNIGDDMIFLGFNDSLSISSCEFPGYKGNHIYFTDNP